MKRLLKLRAAGRLNLLRGVVVRPWLGCQT
jgi:hypothetical protein